MKIGLICIGNELLMGKTINTNMAAVGDTLFRNGLPLTTSWVIPDTGEVIRETFATAWASHDVVITTGGLGPTTDDITKATIAGFFGRELEFHQDIWDYVAERFARRGLVISDVNRCQAEVPAGFTHLHNPLGTAPGLLYQTEGKTLAMLQGVPYEMENLLKTRVLPVLLETYHPIVPFLKNLHTAGVPESDLAQGLADLDLSGDVTLAYLPSPGRVTLRVFGNDHIRCQAMTDEIVRRFGYAIWGTGDDTIAGVLMREMLTRGLTLAVAESCTGGLIGKTITDIPGSSGFFLGGAIVYSNALKNKLLHVPMSTLDTFGAVSEETAVAMAEGLRSATGADYALAVTGIAGPDGGTPEKPVGLVYLAIASARGTRPVKLVHSGTRPVIRTIASEKAMLEVFMDIRKLPMSPEHGGMGINHE